jgi:hypothetical protein
LVSGGKTYLAACGGVCAAGAGLYNFRLEDINLYKKMLRKFHKTAIFEYSRDNVLP